MNRKIIFRPHRDGKTTKSVLGNEYILYDIKVHVICINPDMCVNECFTHAFTFQIHKTGYECGGINVPWLS